MSTIAVTTRNTLFVAKARAIWQWIRNPKGELVDGRKVTIELFRRLLGEELRKVSGLPGAADQKSDEAAWLFDRLVSSDEFVDFLTGPYEFVARVEQPLAA